MHKNLCIILQKERYGAVMNERYTEMLKLLESKRFPELMREIDTLNSVHCAEFFEELDRTQQIMVFRMLKKDMSAEIFAELSHQTMENIIRSVSDSELSAIMEELFVDDAVDMLEELPAGMVKRILKTVKPDTRATINRFLSYPEGSAGSIMTAEFIDFRRNMTVAQAIANIKNTGDDKETVYVGYITDEKRILQGSIRIEKLLFSDDSTLLCNIMNTDFVCAGTHDDKEDVADTISKYDLTALPIVDAEGRLVGIVTVDDAIDVIEEKNTEDMEMMAAMTPADKPYLRTGVLSTFSKRIPWLLLLMVTSTFTGRIISGFESALSAFPVLIAFIPMLMGTGGNSGGQSSVAVIRGLALEEIRPSDSMRVMLKESSVAILSGGVLAVCNLLKIMFVDNLIFDMGVDTLAAIVISLTLFTTVLVSKLVGGVLPIFAKVVGLDPAVMASPFITTIVDAVSLLLYFGFARVLLLK